MPSLSANSPIARAQLDLEALPPAERLDRWREALEPVFEITPPHENGAAFSGAVAMAHLDDALISEVRSGPQLFARSRAHARRTGLDHFMIQTFRHGQHDGACGDNPVHRGRGDVWVLDLAQETRTQASGFSNITLIIPRDRLLPLLKGGEVHGTTLRAGTAPARLIANHLETLAAAALELTPGEAKAAVDAAALMIAGAWPRLRESRPQIAAAVRATGRRTICDYIDRHLTDEGLTPETLLRLFRMSRATLYRLFADDGGVAAYILGRRLDRCRALLAAASGGERTIGDIAFSHGFASEAHFSRAFRRRFGLTPRDARGAGRDLPRDPRGAAEVIADWLATLRRPDRRYDAD
ncbi:MAG TPA: helix-turn-helix domain-containing protein [Stellaceae bacterium]|nr:helix-turn-helix domain-containing protein [Stellaceae bacterium]